MARSALIDHFSKLVVKAMETMPLPCTPGQAYDATVAMVGQTSGDRYPDYSQVCRFLTQFTDLFAKVGPASYTLASRASEPAPVPGSKPPVDFLEPNWDEVKRCHNWRGYVPEDLVPLWTSLPVNVRAILAADYQRLASLENWE